MWQSWMILIIFKNVIVIITNITPAMNRYVVKFTRVGPFFRSIIVFNELSNRIEIRRPYSQTLSRAGILILLLCEKQVLMNNKQ